MSAAAIETDQDLDAFLSGIVRIAERPDFTPELTDWVEDTTGKLGSYMTSGRSPDGTPYRPLKHPRPAGHNQKSGPLIDLGDMLLSLIGDGSGHIESVTGSEAALGTGHVKDTNRGNIPVASIHQHGSTKARIPARPFVGFNPEIVAEAERLIADGFERRIAAL